MSEDFAPENMSNWKSASDSSSGVFYQTSKQGFHKRTQILLQLFGTLVEGKLIQFQAYTRKDIAAC